MRLWKWERVHSHVLLAPESLRRGRQQHGCWVGQETRLGYPTTHRRRGCYCSRLENGYHPNRFPQCGREARELTMGGLRQSLSPASVQTHYRLSPEGAGKPEGRDGLAEARDSQTESAAGERRVEDEVGQRLMSHEDGWMDDYRV